MTRLLMPILIMLYSRVRANLSTEQEALGSGVVAICCQFLLGTLLAFDTLSLYVHST